MSRLLSTSEYPPREYELDDKVTFAHEGGHLTGKVVRVYNTREWYHVEVDHRRYEVHVTEII